MRIPVSVLVMMHIPVSALVLTLIPESLLEPVSVPILVSVFLLILISGIVLIVLMPVFVSMPVLGISIGTDTYIRYHTNTDTSIGYCIIPVSVPIFVSPTPDTGFDSDT